jgi:hypothetical protein
MSRRRTSRVAVEPGTDGVDANASMRDLSDITASKDTPRNPDGSIQTDGDIPVVQAQAIGALDVESDRHNKERARTMTDKALGKRVLWNSEDALDLIEALYITFPGERGSMVIHVSRVEPEPKVQYPPIRSSNIPDAQALYKYIQQCHLKSVAAKYKVSFQSSGGMQRGTAPVYMPDTSDPPAVQVLSGQQPQQPQYGQQPYPSPQYGQGGGYGAPPGGGGYGYPQPPQQAQPPPADRIIVVNQPPQQAPQQPAPAPVQAQAPQQPQPLPYYPPTAPGAFDSQRAMFEMMQAQGAQMMAMMEKVAEKMNRPPPPAGFIPLPSEDYPLPPNFVRIPGGMIPAPSPAMYAPQGVGAVPASHPVATYTPIAAPVAAPAPAVVQPPPPSFDQQLDASVNAFTSAMRSFEKMKNVAQSFAAPEEPEEPEPAAVQAAQTAAESPMHVQDVGGLAMLIDKKTNAVAWAPTILGALPKLMEAGKKGFEQYQAAVKQQHVLTQDAVNSRIRLAQAVTAAQQPQVPAQMAPPPPQAAPVQAAPPPPQRAPQPSPTPARSSAPIPTRPIF